MIEIHCDGACRSSNQQGGWAFVILNNNEPQPFFGGVVDTTNNQMEIMASLVAIKYLKSLNITKFKLFTDSMYVIGAITKGNKRNKNIKWLEVLDKAVESCEIEWVHEDGHSNNKWNNVCDVLAVAGSHLILK